MRFPMADEEQLAQRAEALEDRTMSDKTRAKLSKVTGPGEIAHVTPDVRHAGYNPSCPLCLMERDAALTAHEQAVAAEAVLAFAATLPVPEMPEYVLTPIECAERYIAEQGWSLPAAERTKP